MKDQRTMISKSVHIGILWDGPGNWPGIQPNLAIAKHGLNGCQAGTSTTERLVQGKASLPTFNIPLSMQEARNKLALNTIIVWLLSSQLLVKLY